ncbi:hypothetical protein BJ978_002330 [Agromyces terreus]|uniref:Uncharacterized protein n=1 Tax=Agromyces terreus TaxID=424795 RepID=A0A9X2H8X2_9MICO|nr:hypothetical protein [Agromyces terreus]MCP2371654.1 hypothetical protein [Agromyces terreus]
MNDTNGAVRIPTSGARPAPFDVRDFARTAQGSLRASLDLDAVAGLPAAAARTLRTLAVLEGATMAHLRNVLVTPTHKDARVTAFLVSWAYEKYWIADALHLIADAAAPAGASTAESAPRAPARETGRGPIRRALAGFGQGPDVVGAHLALGFVDDLVLDLAYERLGAAERADGVDAAVVLAEAVARIRAVKARHTRFFEAEAAGRLTASPRSARLARRELARSPWPLGSGSVAADDRRAFARFALGHRAGGAGGTGAERLARGIRSLPGIDARTAARVIRRLEA